MRKLLVLLLLITLNGFGQNANHVQGELIIQLNTATNPQNFIREFQKDQLIGVKGFTQLSSIVNIYLIQFDDPSIDLDRTKHLLNTYQEVNVAQKNHYVSDRETIPSDVFFDELWHLKNTGSTGGTVDADIDATDAWDITTGGITTHNDSIVVCVVETGGVDITHEDLQGNLWKNNAEIPDDGIDNDGNGFIDDFDGWNVMENNDNVGFGSHGTRVSGMIGAKGNNTIGVTGVNWDVKMMIVKGQNASNEATVLAAYNYPLVMRKLYNETFGEEGAFVVATNSSWGIDGGDPASSPLWCAMYDSLGNYGILNIAATTNNNSNVDEVGDLPTTCTSDFLIGVTMTNSTDVRAGSGFGTTHVDLAAPGSSVRLTTPGNNYGITSGTSFATPCVTGAVALAYSAPCPEFINLVKHDPAEAALKMRDYILDGVDPVTSLGSEVATGGRLNVKNSIDLMLAECDADACVPPFNVRITALSDTSITVVWDGFTTDYVLSIQEGSNTPIEIVIEGEQTISFDTLTPCREYIISVKANCDGELSESSFSLNFTTDGCCINPDLINPSKTEESLTIAWDDILNATQYNFRYTKLDTEDWISLEDVTSPLSIDGLEGCTQYEFQIHTVCDDSTRGFSESTIFRTLGCGACTEEDYCPVEGANDNLEWIESIQFNGFTNETGPNNGWLRSEQIITALVPGETYSITITPGFAGATFTERYSIYIDYNHNGVFDAPIEIALLDFSAMGPITQMITIPASAEIGVTKIRIGMSALSSPISCPTAAFFGEYEDYCVYLGPTLGIDDNTLTSSISLYPNPVNTELFIQSDADINQIRIYSSDGKLIINNDNYDGTPINTSQLNKGIYIVNMTVNNTVVTKKFVKQ